ncbi:MAG: hypothetical protein EOO38_20570 [Cytophagaceae bacterium]|nr:MAG: hypothetical protein EOO38_20570 [Cytophagaceae bacterium]
MLNVFKVCGFHIGLLIIGLMGSSATAASWLCVSEAGAGFNGAVGTQTFKSVPYAGGDNFLVRPPLISEASILSDGGRNTVYVVFKVGNPSPVAEFYTDVDDEDLPWVVSVSGRVDFGLNVKLGRFTLMNYYSFLSEKDGNNAFMLAGSCTQLD